MSDRGASLWHWRQCYEEHRKALAFLRMVDCKSYKFLDEIVDKVSILHEVRERISLKWSEQG